VSVLRLPKQVEEGTGVEHFARELAARGKPLWSGSELRIAEVGAAPGLKTALKSVYSAGRIVRGYEDAERSLAAEARGLSHVDKKTGVVRGGRVSRLLILADDGAERLYRNVESLLRKHEPRLLALRVSANERALGEMVFGGGQVARLLLVEHKDAVSTVLLAVAAQWGSDRAPR